MAYIDTKDIYKLFENGVANLHVSDIDVLPRADVVEVVRCKGCKHGEKTTQFRTDCTTKCILHNKTMVDNDFCSYGERK